MNQETLARLLDDVRSGRVSVTDALSALRWMPFAELGFAKADTHRSLRRGAPEAVYCPGKSLPQIVEIATALRRGGGPVLLTRVTAEVAAGVMEAFPDATYAADARLVVLGNPPRRKTGCVGVLTGGTGDLPVAEEAAWTAEVMGAEVARAYDVGVSGLHRLGAHRGLLERSRALVVVAGMDGALPTVVAGLTRAPVIGVPTSVGYGAHLGGLAPLLTMLNACAPGVAVVNIDNGFGAGYLAACINGSAAGANAHRGGAETAGVETDSAETDGTETGGVDARGAHASRIP